ncbi:hypothetical protein BJ944DRAFT_262265, partial [Cunninghamella echinulata]
MSFFSKYFSSFFSYFFISFFHYLSMSKVNGLPLPSINAVLRNDHTTTIITLFYISLSLCATFINKYLTTASEYKFTFPYTVVFFQLVLSIIFIYFWKIWQSRCPSWIRFTTLVSANWRIILPSTCIYVFMILLDPVFLTQVPLSNYISMRAPCLLFILCYTMMYQQRRGNNSSKSSRWIWISCLIQYSGIWLMNNNNNGVLFTYNWITLLYALFITSYAISVQWTLKKLQYDVTQFLQWQLILATISMVPILLVSGELKLVYQSVLFLDEVGFWIQIIIGALLSLSLHFLMISLIKYSSPLSFIVASICKTCLQALVAWICFKNTLSFY